VKIAATGCFFVKSIGITSIQSLKSIKAVIFIIGLPVCQTFLHSFDLNNTRVLLISTGTVLYVLRFGYNDASKAFVNKVVAAR
jgi:hypothetical protein